MSYTYPYPRPMVTTDCITLRLHENKLQIALIQRGKEPFKGQWAMPGGFLEMDEIGECGAARELLEETGIIAPFVIPTIIADSVYRDPRGRIISLIYFTMVSSETDIFASDDAQDGKWFDIQTLPQLASDHCIIIAKSLEHIRDIFINKTAYYNIVNQYFSNEVLLQFRNLLLTTIL